ncbi:MAG: ATP-dependent helicase [Exilispira sp.]
MFLAPAGSGKTRVITYKILYLIEKKGITPSKIVALTFTNKAANEMKSRIISIIPSKGKYINASTFHSYALKLLRKYCSILDYKENFSIYDNDDSIVIINRIKKELNLDLDSRLVLSSISRLKNSINSYEQYLSLIEQNEYCRVIKLYIEYLKSHNAMDFDDILLNLYFLLTRKDVNCQKASDEIRNNIEYLLIDEYQDTNTLQYLIIKSLLNKNNFNNITIVGDDDQGIYSFRGSTIENILRFEKDFAPCKVICLEKNYRSSQTILHAARLLINNNRNRKVKEMIAENKSNGKIVLFEALDPSSEALFVYNKIYELLYKNGIRYKDIAILYRNNYLSRPFEELFIIRNLKHKVWGGYNFYSREEIKDISAYLFAILNPYDEVSLLRIINVPKRGIGVKLVEKLVASSKKFQVHIFDLLKIISNHKEFSQSQLFNIFSNNEVESLKEFYYLLDEYRSKIFENNRKFSILFKKLVEQINYYDYLKSYCDEKSYDSKIGYLESFLSSLFNFNNYENENVSPFDIADRLRLLMNNDIDEKEEDKVNLLTMHAAKGLEFKVVFIVGAEKGIIPSDKITNRMELEEERRLFYVAMTRAKEYLFISYCNERTKYGKKYNCFQSEFIDEIPEEDIIFDEKKIDATVTASDIASIKNILLTKKFK